MLQDGDIKHTTLSVRLYVYRIENQIPKEYKGSLEL